MSSDGRRTGGEDWFEVALYLRWSGFGKVRESLDRLQVDARSGRSLAGRGPLPGSDAVWRVQPTGCRLGAGDSGPLMAWRIERSGIVIGLADRETPHETMPSGFVRISGEVLTPIGDAREVWEEVVRWLAQLGASVERAVVSRVDMCVDLPGVSVSPFVRAFCDGCAIRRVRKAHAYRQGEDSETDTVFWEGRRETGLSIGCGTRVRIYDKAIECKDPARRSWLIQRRWGGRDQEHAVRVEFQLRREFLKAEKCKPNADGVLDRPVIDTVQDYFEQRAELARYLTTSWLRFVLPGFDRRHTERAVDMPEWTAVREAFEAWTGGSADGMTWKPIPRRGISVKDLMVQIRGCAESAFARQCRDVDGADDLLGALAEELWMVIEADGDIRARVAAKRLELVSEIVIQDDDPDDPIPI